MLKHTRRFIALVSGLVIGFSGINFDAIGRADFTTAESVVAVSENVDVLYGDANLDGSVRESDAVLIMQAISNPDEYGLGAGTEKCITEQGVENADVYNNGDGMTVRDALVIQMYKTLIIQYLPHSYRDGRNPHTETTTTTTTTTTTSTTATTSTTTSTSTTKPTTTSTTSTTTSTTTTTKPTTTSTTSTTTTTKPTTTSTTSTTTTTEPTTTSTTSTTTTTKPTTTSTTSTTTTTKPTTTSTTSTTTTTKPTTTSTTSTTTSTTTSSTTSSPITTVSYYYEKYVEDDGTVYYLNEDGLMIGPDSAEDVYNGLIAAAKKYNFKNYKIVYSEQIIPYAYVIHCHIDGIKDRDAWQIAPINDLQYICPLFYNYYSEDDDLHSFRYVMWRPDEAVNEEDMYCDCGNQHYEVYEDAYIRSIISSYWQLIPTDENGNDILKLASDSMVLKNSLKIS